MRTAPFALLALLAVTGCNDRSRPAMGDEHSVIVVADDALWAQVEDTVLTTLQPRVFAVRDEPTFRVSHTTPTDPYWGDLRRFRQILAIGRVGDPWVDEPLGRAGVEPRAPEIVEAESVWARNQRVTVLVLPETADEAAVVMDHVDELASLLDYRYRAWSVNRMFTSGLDVELRDTLAAEAGFSVQVPRVYRWRQVSDTTYLFLNDQPDASQLVRSLLVTWRSPGTEEPSVEAALDWRDAVTDRYYDWHQVTERDRLQVRPVEAEGLDGIEVRGVWDGTVEGFPLGGSFITRMIECPEQDRQYLLDAWLYAPARAKYQYIIQLETLLDGFTCEA